MIATNIPPHIAAKLEAGESQQSFASEFAFRPRTCCACGQCAISRNIAMLPWLCALPGKGWGCVVCGIPANGAIAIICDRCAETGKDIADIAWACCGDGAGFEPIDLTKARGEFGHDLSKHPELAEANEFDPEIPDRSIASPGPDGGGL